MSLHLLPVFQKIYEFYGYTETLKSFCKETSEVLETIGDVNFETAIACLKDVSEGRSNRPERELDGAIMSLRTAYEAFCSGVSRVWGSAFVWAMRQMEIEHQTADSPRRLEAPIDD